MQINPMLTVFAVSRARQADLPTGSVLKTVLLGQAISPGADAIGFLITDKLIKREIADRKPTATPAAPGDGAGEGSPNDEGSAGDTPGSGGEDPGQGAPGDYKQAAGKRVVRKTKPKQKSGR